MFIRSPPGYHVTVSVSLLCTLLLSTGGAAQSPPSLQLEEIASWTVPDSFAVGGLTAASDGSLVLWSPVASYLLVQVNGSFYEVGAGLLERPVGAALLADRSEVEVVDAGRKQLVRLARGVLISADALSLPMEAESAVRTADGWFIAGKDDTGAHVVYFLGADRAPQLVLRTPPDARTSLPQRAARLSESNGEVLLSLAYPPFSTFVINPAEGLRLRFSPADAVPIDEEKADRTIPFWIGLPAIGLDGGWFVQSLADVRSDRRLLFLYGADGAVVRQTEIEVPLGIAARLPEQPVLIVMRQLGLREIVFYRWRWR